MNLPTGTVTFLFTDIEGSTKLWDTHPEAMRLALELHDSLLREAIEGHNGYVFKTVGDAFCAAFPTAPDALNAALEAHLALATQEWGETGPLRVRMGLHAGNARERDNDYFGPTLNRVARLQGIGHGQQTLLSQATYELVNSELPTDATLRDLGMHRLKDLAAPEHVWQLNHPSLPQEFAPLMSLNYQPTNLPQQLTSFIGREKEMQEIKELLQQTRLLTLTGSGGTGKTRLALQASAEVLEQYADGAWLVELAALSDAELVPQAVAEALSIREAPGEPITKTLVSALKDKQMLLVLDNCEHLLDASARLVDSVLKSCRKVSVLVSSRETLGIGGERAYRVPSLSVPDLKQAQTPQNLSAYESVCLFIERAVAVKSDFTLTNQNAAVMASVCHRLDGIPLAIELAAARVRAMALEQIEARLDNRFRLLTGGSRTALPRQQTLRALIDWSFDLLPEREKATLLRLSVFAGGWTLEAAEMICSSNVVEEWEVLDLLTSLVDKSLVVYEEREGNARYRLLETVRQYARERLEETGEAEAAQIRHRNYFLTFAEEAEAKLTGPDSAAWLERLEEEHENLRTVLHGSLLEEQSMDGLQMCATLHRFWMMRGYLSEGREWCWQFLGKENAQGRTYLRGKVLQSAANLAYLQTDFTFAKTCFEQSLDIWREIRDRSGIAYSLNGLGALACSQGDYALARTYYQESLDIQRKIGNRIGIVTALNNLGNLASEQGDYAAARAYQQENLDLSREMGDQTSIAFALNGLGIVAHSQSDYASARRYYEESLAVRREIGDRIGIVTSLDNLGIVAHSQGDYAAARAYQQENLDLSREMGDQTGITFALNGLGTVAQSQGDFALALAYYKQCLDIRREIGDSGSIANSLEAFASLTTKEGRLQQAAVLWGAAAALREEIGSPLSQNPREKYDQEVAQVRQGLGQEAFSIAWANGRAMTLEQAIKCAMEEPR